MMIFICEMTITRTIVSAVIMILMVGQGCAKKRFKRPTEVSATVIDAFSGEAVPNASIFVHAQGSGYVGAAFRTDSLGRLSFTIYPDSLYPKYPSELTLEAGSQGFRNMYPSEFVDIQPGKPNNVILTLHPLICDSSYRDSSLALAHVFMAHFWIGLPQGSGWYHGWATDGYGGSFGYSCDSFRWAFSPYEPSASTFSLDSAHTILPAEDYLVNGFPAKLFRVISHATKDTSYYFLSEKSVSERIIVFGGSKFPELGYKVLKSFVWN